MGVNKNTTVLFREIQEEGQKLLAMGINPKICCTNRGHQQNVERKMAGEKTTRGGRISDVSGANGDGDILERAEKGDQEVMEKRCEGTEMMREVNMFDGDKFHNFSQTLSPNDIRKVLDDADKQQRIKMFGQKAKADAGKLPMNLVPTQIVRDIAEVRQYGNEKYGDPDNWRKVEKLRYVAALERHLLAYKDYLNGDDDGLDKESEIEHHKHMACNMAFICEMERWEKEEKA